MQGRAQSFGAVAATYERFRPGYPDELVDAVLAHSARPVRTALEIGAGTGKATRAFARRGVTVTATDPDPAMLAELRRQLPGAVTVTASLEDLAPTTTYDLVFAAASLHWTAPVGRWPRVAALLGPGGVFASFGGPLRLADADLETAVQDARSPFLGGDDITTPDASAGLQWPASELATHDLFTDVRELVLPRRLELTADDWVGHLSTISAYLELPPDVRAQAFARIRGVLPDRVVVTADLTLHLARRGAQGSATKDEATASKVSPLGANSR